MTSFINLFIPKQFLETSFFLWHVIDVFKFIKNTWWFRLYISLCVIYLWSLWNVCGRTIFCLYNCWECRWKRHIIRGSSRYPTAVMISSTHIEILRVGVIPWQRWSHITPSGAWVTYDFGHTYMYKYIYYILSTLSDVLSSFVWVNWQTECMNVYIEMQGRKTENLECTNEMKTDR